jgi:orotidine-5'-phosphate decarboxylase
MNTDLVVALDFSSTEEADRLISQLVGLPVVYKVGLQLFLAAGPDWVRSLTASGARVFLDLKFHDIPNTVARATVESAKLGAEFVTVHLSGGRRMLDEIAVAVERARNAGEIRISPRVLGVSVLTSFQEEEWVASVSHMAKISEVRSIHDSVLHFADLVSRHPGVGGMVCSPLEVSAVRLKYPDLFLMVPGIRLAGGNWNDQQRVMTPAEAKKAGASAIVVGRPITGAADRRQAVETFLQELS